MVDLESSRPVTAARNWEIPESALGGAPEGAQGKMGCSGRVLQRVLREIGGAPESALKGALPVDVNRKSTLKSTPWSTPNFPEHPREHLPEHFQGFHTLSPL